MLFVTGLLLGLYSQARAQNLTSAQISVISQRLAQGAVHSWEYGTRAEALLELNAPTYSVVSFNPVPPPQSIPSNLTSALSEVFTIAHNIVVTRSLSNITGPQPLINDTSAGDPASIGVAVLLANWTGQWALDGLDYAGAARDQLDYLFQNVSKTSDGALSHRVDQLQLWSDSVYMVPPFLAYYGVLTENQTILVEAYTQISLYRKYLRDTAAGNLWKHIQLGQTGNDDGHWSTGNAWAAAGMIRVLGTIQRSPYANMLKSQQTDLANWVSEIHGAMYTHINSNGLFYNYADNSTTFYDTSSAALLASTVYRLSLLSNVYTYIPLAEQVRKALLATAGAIISITNTSTSPAPSTTSAPPATGTTTPGMLHLTSEGWLTPVVNPYAYGAQGSDSPEGQAFILEMQAAWRDWVADGAKGANSAHEARPHVSLIGAMVALPWLMIVIC
ncbi:Six-hairpin glycosidase-like protein [Suillus clintonianus]|uniref:Six-hairpin glycosidase-like protein n=1 Tax=Suillus clintonianus TaxID=1904413 RepID=UPI001B85E20E|nr:Six-hairpin glycosidase-like protein [Suillus clintonianus]KAG2148973.1 Six-hairpin glycosidase-like protein [Suillus clintonianus]